MPIRFLLPAVVKCSLFGSPKHDATPQPGVQYGPFQLCAGRRLEALPGSSRIGGA